MLFHCCPLRYLADTVAGLRIFEDNAKDTCCRLDRQGHYSFSMRAGGHVVVKAGRNHAA
jgi:hypothetical protein